MTFMRMAIMTFWVGRVEDPNHDAEQAAEDRTELALLVWAALTGSVAMNTMPNRSAHVLGGWG